MIRLVKKDFRQWLRFNARTIVGDPTENSTCPLCRFLKSRGAKKVLMKFSARIVDGKLHDNSRWAVKFQKGAVELQRSLDVEGLRGREALQVIDSINE